MNNKGFTLAELVAAIVGIVSFSVTVYGIYLLIKILQKLAA